jgi:hypothetical protein
MSNKVWQIFKIAKHPCRQHEQAVSFSLDYRLDDQGIGVRFTEVLQSLCFSVQTRCGTPQPPIQRIGQLFLRGIKRPELVAGHSVRLILTFVFMYVELYCNASICLPAVMLSNEVHGNSIFEFTQLPQTYVALVFSCPTPNPRVTLSDVLCSYLHVLPGSYAQMSGASCGMSRLL